MASDAGNAAGVSAGAAAVSAGAAAVSAGSAELQLRGIKKQFGRAVVVDDLDLTIPAGEFFALLGPSGCGKTTTLRMVAGLERPDAGQIMLSGVDITDLRPFKRPVNTVFQSYALFPHLTIAENVAFGLKERRRKDIREKVSAILETVELADMAHRKPAQLSGGQQQRVALARAIVNEPQVLLLDEPLGALDMKLRRSMQYQVKQIQQELGLTFLHVTHDQEEAMTMADTVAVMNQGRIEQMGAPEELYESPRTVFVANFLGTSNLIAGSVAGRDGALVTATVYGQQVRLPADRLHSSASEVFIGVRPEKIRVAAAEAADSGAVPAGHNALSGTVIDSSFIGIGTEYVVQVAGSTDDVKAFVQNDGSTGRLAPGAAVTLSWRVDYTFGLDGHADPHAGEYDADRGMGANPDPKVAS